MQENLDAGYEDGFPDLMIGSADVVRSQLAIPQPVIAAINGDAIGLGGGVIKAITERVSPSRLSCRRATCADRTRKVANVC